MSEQPTADGFPTVGVVIATRNRPDMVREAIAAIAAQDYPGRVETVVVFDQCEPDTALVLDDAQRSVRVIANQRKPGLAGGRNSGIMELSTELVAFCDDDDLWLPGKLTAQVAELMRHPGAGLSCTGITVSYDGTALPRVLEQDTIELADLLRSRLVELHPSTFLSRRAALVDGFGLVDEEIPGSHAEDYDFLLRAAKYAPIPNVRIALVEVRWHPRSYFSQHWDTISQALQWLLLRYPEFATVPRGYARIAGQIAFAEAAAGRRREALSWIARTFRASPVEPRAELSLVVALRLMTPDFVVRQLNSRGKGI